MPGLSKGPKRKWELFLIKNYRRWYANLDTEDLNSILEEAIHIEKEYKKKMVADVDAMIKRKKNAVKVSVPTAAKTNSKPVKLNF